METTQSLFSQTKECSTTCCFISLLHNPFLIISFHFICQRQTETLSLVQTITTIQFSSFFFTGVTTIGNQGRRSFRMMSSWQPTPPRWRRRIRCPPSSCRSTPVPPCRCASTGPSHRQTAKGKAWAPSDSELWKHHIHIDALWVGTVLSNWEWPRDDIPVSGRGQQW